MVANPSPSKQEAFRRGLNLRKCKRPPQNLPLLEMSDSGLARTSLSQAQREALPYLGNALRRVDV